MLRLFFVSGLFFCRHRRGAAEGLSSQSTFRCFRRCRSHGLAGLFHALRNSSGSFALFAAIRLASSLLNNFAAERRPGSLSEST